MESLCTTVVEAREETMISPTGIHSIPTTRTAHFLKPSISSFNAPIYKCPSPNDSSIPSKPNVFFHGWRSEVANWKLWAEKMAMIHKSKWEKAGILDAVMNSAYQIRRDEELICGLAEKWCSRTNSFVFRFGEATLTLEDMAVFGFSVCGSSVFLPVEEGEESEEIKQKLETAVKELKQSRSKKAAIGLWVTKFQDSESSIEHEAFLVAWLSKYVLASTRDSIRKETIPIAIHLARGTRIALAPPVLASIYRYLSILKSLIVKSRESPGNSDDDACSRPLLWSPFQLVQVWAWERFLQMQPLPNELGRGQPRIARWSMKERIKDSAEEEVSVVLDSAADNFIWRPYALPLGNWDFPKFYCEKESWVELKSSSDDDVDLVGFARCVRVSCLVGMDTIEKYFPHRVSMQFGFDQDIPDHVAGDSNESCQIEAWRDYSKDLDGVRLYVPSRLFEADVTTRYQQWWKHQVAELQRIELQSLGSQKKRMGKKRAKKTAIMSHKNIERNKDSNDRLTDFGSFANRSKIKQLGNKSSNNVDDAEDKMTIPELLKADKKINGNSFLNEDFQSAVDSMVLETQPAERRRKKPNDGDDYRSGQSSEDRFSPAHGQISSTGSDSAVVAELRESGLNNATLTNSDAASNPVIKLEPVEEVMKEAGKGIVEHENQSNTGGATKIGEIIARIEDHLSYIEKKLGLQ